MSTFLTWLASLLTSSVLDRALEGWKAVVASRTNADTLATQLTIEAFKTDIEQRRLAAGLAWGPLGIAVMLFVVPTAAYFAKVLIWDTMLGLGSTPEVFGLTARMMEAVVSYVLPGGIGLKALHMAATRFGR